VPADPTQWNSISLRWLEWKSGIAEIKNSLWFGTGTGGTKAALRKHYDKVELGDFAQDYDSHNQYIETFLEIGIFGFLTLCAGFIIPLRFSLMHSEPTLLALVFIISMASITATVFEKSQGIIFYCSFVSLAMYSQYGSEGSR
jgi:O-antigen ligase